MKYRCPACGQVDDESDIEEDGDWITCSNGDTSPSDEFGAGDDDEFDDVSDDDDDDDDEGDGL